MRTLQPVHGRDPGATYLPSTPATVLWGRLPCATDAPVLHIDPGTEVTIDTVSHEGMLDDQGSDPLAFFAGHGVAPDDVLADAVAIAARSRAVPRDGPHVVTGPIHGARARCRATCSRSPCSRRRRGSRTASSRTGTAAAPCRASARAAAERERLRHACATATAACPPSRAASA